MDQHRTFDNLLDALDAVDAGVKVDQSHLRDLAKDAQGDYECGVSFSPEDCSDDGSCAKNPGHTSFIPVKDFKLEDIPAQFRTKENIESIKQWSDMTVKITVKYTSVDRPSTFPDGTTAYPSYQLRGSRRIRRFGTGFVQSVFPASPEDMGKICPCLICRTSDNPEREFWFAQVFTATHVVFDNSEASNAVVDCFYDSDDDLSTVKKLYGVFMDNAEDREYEDVCDLFCVTHDRDLMEKLQYLSESHKKSLMPNYRNNFGVLISHPHGKSKKITVGQVLHLTIPINAECPTQTPIKFNDNTECRLPLFPWRQDEQLSGVFDSEPGQTFALPESLKFILPENSEFARRFFDISTSWFVFPMGTKFLLGEDAVCLPSSAEFRFDVLFENPLSYLSYDVDACPGSSGAGLLQDGGRSLYSTFPHSGSSSTYNKSGLRSYSILTRSSNKTSFGDSDDDDDDFDDYVFGDEDIETQTSGCLTNVLNQLFPCFNCI